MIIPDYSTFRSLANPEGPIGTDGLTEFDPTKMRFDGFDDGISVSSTSEFPILLSCNDEAYDSPAYVEEFDWYVSQGTTVEADCKFIVSRHDDTGGTRSGTIELDLSAWAETEYPDPFDLSAIRVLYFGIDVYVIRRRDSSIQRIDLMKYFIDALSPKTNLE